MEQFAPYIGMTLVGLGIIGLAVGIGRIVIWYRRNPGKTGPVSKSDRRPRNPQHSDEPP